MSPSLLWVVCPFNCAVSIFYHVFHGAGPCVAIGEEVGSGGRVSGRDGAVVGGRSGDAGGDEVGGGSDVNGSRLRRRQCW